MATVLEFHIPLSREDLLSQGDRSQYVVSECCTAAEVTNRLEGTQPACTPAAAYMNCYVTVRSGGS